MKRLIVFSSILTFIVIAGCTSSNGTKKYEDAKTMDNTTIDVDTKQEDSSLHDSNQDTLTDSNIPQDVQSDIHKQDTTHPDVKPDKDTTASDEETDISNNDITTKDLQSEIENNDVPHTDIAEEDVNEKCLNFDPAIKENIEKAFLLAENKAKETLNNPSIMFVELAGYPVEGKDICTTTFKWNYAFTVNDGQTPKGQVTVSYPGWKTEMKLEDMPLGVFYTKEELLQKVKKSLEEIIELNKDKFDQCPMQSNQPPGGFITLRGSTYYENNEVKTNLFWEVSCAGSAAMLYFNPTTGEAIEPTDSN